MRWLKRLLIGLLVLLLGLVGVAFLLPDRAAAERSIVIDRPASMIHAVLNGYGRFNEWSPWADRDPATQYRYEGPAHGVGASMSWQSDDPDVGSGSQTIVAVVPDERIDAELDFGPMGKARYWQALAPEGPGTRVTWGFDTELPLRFDASFLYGLIGRYIGLSLDSMVGSDYELGLARLKTLMEGMPNADIAGLAPELHEVAAQPMYYVSAESSLDAGASAAVLGEAYAEIGRLLAAASPPIAQVGPVFTRITAGDESTWRFDAGIPVDRNDAAPAGRVAPGSTYGGKAADFRHVGPYDQLSATHRRIDAWLAVRKLVQAGPRWELYVSDPTTTPAAELVTVVRVPLE